MMKTGDENRRKDDQMCGSVCWSVDAYVSGEKGLRCRY